MRAALSTLCPILHCRLGDFIDRLSEFDKEMNGVVIESGETAAISSVFQS